MKTEHFKNEKMSDEHIREGAICPAELCDIFECPNLSEKKLALQTYTMRSVSHEGKPDYRNGDNSYSYSKRQDLPPFRWEMAHEYNPIRKATLL